MYPIISEYIEAIKVAEDNFDKLKNLRPVLDEEGQPVMTSGNFAVVFKMKDEQTGKLHAVKCFLKEQEGRAEAYRMIAEELEYVSSTFLTPIKYLDKELFVDSANSEDSEFPVLLMDWVEGQTLDKYIREHIDDQYELSLLAYQFSRLAMWLMPQPFAHGDLKPDNILVKEDGTLVLVDYDGMYVPAMKGQRARELGSPDFRHPSRTEDDFDEHIDDFPLASILLSLKAISLIPELMGQHGASERLLFSEKDYRDLSESEVLDSLKLLMRDSELATLLSLFVLASTQKNLSLASFRLFNLCRPKEPKDEHDGTIIENGLLFTNNKRRLIKNNNSNVVVTIPSETRYVKHNVFTLAGDDYTPHFIRILNDKISWFPTSAKILVPNNSIKESLVKKGFYEEQIIVGDIFVDEYGVVYSADKTTLIRYQYYLEHSEYHIIEECNTIEECAFNVFADPDPDDGTVSFSGNSLETLYIPSILKKVGNCAFDGCMKLKTIVIPEGTETDMVQLLPHWCKIVESNYDNLRTEVTEEDLANAWTDEYGVKYSSDQKRLLKAPNVLHTYHIRSETIVICNNAFIHNESLESITIPDSVMVIGECAFMYCKSLSRIFIPQNVAIIETCAFAVCSNIMSIDVCGNNKFYDSRNNCNAIIDTKENILIVGCKNTIIPHDIEEIGGAAFKGCCGLTSIIIPENVTKIKDAAFGECTHLSSIIIPMGVNEIRMRTFAGCTNLSSVTITGNLRKIGRDAFLGCNHLTKIYVPKGTKDKFEKLYIHLPKNAIVEFEEMTSDKMSKEDLEKTWEDECGGIYSQNRKVVYGIRSLYKSEYEINAGTEVIDNEAFNDLGNEMDYSYLDKIIIPSSVKTIGYAPFNKYLSKIICYSSYFEVDNKTLYTKDKKRLIQCHADSEEFSIPDSVEYIDNFAFYGCKSKRIIIPASVNRIGINPFVEINREDYKFEVISLSPKFYVKNQSLYDNNLRLISYWGKDETISIDDGVKEIGEYAFFLSELKTINLPDSINSIGDCAFGWCFSLKQVLVPSHSAEKFNRIMNDYNDMIRIIE